MKISVVTVALNAAKDLPLTIESVLSQDFVDLEFIVLDGLSWDPTFSTLARYADRINKLAVTEDTGVYDAMNRAAEIASGEFILFMNAGDRFYAKNSLSRMMSRTRENADVVYGNHIFSSQGKDFLKRSSSFKWLRERLLMGRVDGRWHDRIPGHQATLTRTQLLRDLKYDTTYNICADHEFLFRAYDAGATFQYIDELLSRYFGGGLSSLSPLKLQHEWALAYRKYSLRPQLVDKFILGTDKYQPPGHIFSGIFDTYGAEVEHSDSGDPEARRSWVMGLRCISPASKITSGLRLAGRCELSNQRLQWKLGQDVVAETFVPVGDFSIQVQFKKEVGPGSEIVMIPSRIEPITSNDPRLASLQLLIDELHFLPASSLALDVPVDAYISIVDLSQRDADALLRGGWSYVEKETEQVWSVDLNAMLAIRSHQQPSKIKLVVAANPHLDFPQRLDITLNGHLMGRHVFTAEGFTECWAEVPSGAWHRNDLNIVSLVCMELAKPPLDTRTLGVALHGFQVETQCHGTNAE